ncbi:MAG TPA: hypothetical protein PK325_01245 [Cyclobacteriaceae bacterium]|nr:hypothetical protein [Cyclobacteriaceae bacterium]HMV08104.1 hypothetical protein [Cyclobacteriaceae bacterium]HMV88318.1 hypothetical protein [Cyclobacteriaceae bacterium]HMX00745.1 hypothetical protein [Cyclobacteriaceae bacterium]HMX49380.1 hypothetical protein [Cyclobacteriaceae bacterium]
MKHITTYSFLTCLLISTFGAFAQHRVKILAEVPVQFGVGYEVNVSKRFSISAQGGVLSEPNSTIIINILEKLGTTPEIIDIIRDSFKFGLIGEAGVNYNFGKNYVGAYSQFINLRGRGTAPDPIEEYFDENFSGFPIKPGSDPDDRRVSVRSSLWQVGVLYGRRFPLKNEHLEIDAEFGVSKNIWSKSKLYSKNRDLSEMDDEVDETLDYYYSRYGYIPSVTVAFVYKFL